MASGVREVARDVGHTALELPVVGDVDGPKSRRIRGIRGIRGIGDDGGAAFRVDVEHGHLGAVVPEHVHDGCADEVAPPVMIATLPSKPFIYYPLRRLRSVGNCLPIHP